LIFIEGFPLELICKINPMVSPRVFYTKIFSLEIALLD